MRTLAPKAEDIRGRAARRGAGLLLALALGLTAIGSSMPPVGRTATENGSPGGAPKPTGIAARPFQSSQSEGKIAFSSQRRGVFEIYVMNADGTNRTLVTNSGNGENRQPAFAPSGSKIVFSSYRDDNNTFGDDNADIYVIDADGANETQVTNNQPYDFEPAFAPFVNKIVFASNRDDNADIYLMNDDGTNEIRLTNTPARDSMPAFAPFGNKIAFMSERDGNQEIYLMNTNGTNQTRLTNIPASDSDPAFSPDGSKIAFSSDRDGNGEIYVMNPDGTNVVRLTNNTGFDYQPVFSPDGSKIAFTTNRHGNRNLEIYVMNADGTNETRLTNNSVVDFEPTWAPGSVVSLAVNNVSRVEGNSGTTELTFTVTKTGEATQNVTVRVDTANGIAIAPDDYAPIVNQTLTFLPADMTKTVTVTVNGDTTNEENETFLVTLRNATNAFIGDGLGLGTIINDDFTRPISTLPILQVVINEQTLTENPHVIRYTDLNASALTERRSDPLTSGNHDFSFFEEEYYDVFYSNADGTPNQDGAFITIEGVWRDRSMAPPFTPGRFGGMNINQVLLLYPDGTQDFGDFVSSFRRGSICVTNDPDLPDQCIIGSELRAVDGNPLTFPRLGHTSDMNPNERFFLTIGFNGVSGPPSQSAVQFSAATYNASEGANKVTVTATRNGDTSGESSVNIGTPDSSGQSPGNQAVANGAASERTDYTPAIVRLRFAPGETTKTFDVLITDDAYNDDAESFSVTLSDPAGAVLGAQSTATVNITDNDAADGPSPVRDASFNPTFFARQHYSDFLSREPDAAGLNFWVGQTSFCGNPDLQVCRINVSAAFFLSIEYQETGFLVHRAHKAAFGNLPGTPVPIALKDFLAGSRRIGGGVQVGVGNWQQQLEANKVAYFDEFVTGEEFAILYSGISNEQYVDELNLNAGGALSQSERDALVSALNAGTMTRARVLRSVAEDSDLAQAESNRAFVLAQYFGYLRRDPDAAPDTNFDGYNFWLAKLNQFNGNFIQAEMVKAFIQSSEYGDRFGR